MIWFIKSHQVHQVQRNRPGHPVRPELPQHDGSLPPNQAWAPSLLTAWSLKARHTISPS